VTPTDVRWWRGKSARLLLVALGLSLGLVAAEIVLRMQYPRLPSYMGLGDLDYKLLRYDALVRPGQAGPLEALRCPGRSTLHRPSSSPEPREQGALQLLVVGDSVVAGHGAPAGRGVAEVLRGALRRSRGARVQLHKIGLNGAGVCEVIAAARGRLAGGALDAAVVVLFADDLQEPFCPGDANPAEAKNDACDWMKVDLDMMAGQLEASGLPFLDLRRIWHGRPPRYPVAEAEAFAHGGGMPVHPDAVGHKLLADAILPALVQALRPR